MSTFLLPSLSCITSNSTKNSIFQNPKSNWTRTENSGGTRPASARTRPKEPHYLQLSLAVGSLRFLHLAIWKRVVAIGLFRRMRFLRRSDGAGGTFLLFVAPRNAEQGASR